ncbi:MAG: hypothetical protein Q9217_006075 [Psora testacea]
MEEVESDSSDPSSKSFHTPLGPIPLASDVELDLEQGDADLAFRAVDAVHVRVENLNVDIDISPSPLTNPFAYLKQRRVENEARFKPILKNVNIYMPSGTVTAILGASGSGKTSVLNTLSHRIEGGRLRTRGCTLYNGNSKLSSVRSAYVMQQDVLLPMLTVRETLHYAAELRLPPPISAEERGQVVEEVILELGLKECADTRIGNSVHKGCSGGEKRRTSLAVQMLANPSVLFLDEVTTGLDASTAFQLMKTLKGLARNGRTIIVTIHQPRSEIWSLFDNVLLLAGGSPLYSGPANECLCYFGSIGYQLPLFMNPAEYLIDQAAIDNRSPEAEAASSARVQALVDAWEAHFHEHHTQEKQVQEPDAWKLDERRSSIINQATSMSKTDHHAGFARQVNVLGRRTNKVTWRDPYGMAGSLFEATLMSIITGWIFLQVDGSLQGIRSREGAIYIASALQSYLVMLYELYRLTFDIQTFDREYGEGVISVPAWILSRRMARLYLEDVPVPLIYTLIFYFMVGFRPLASQFFIMFGVTLLTHHIAVNLATVCVAISRDFAVASLIGNMIFTLQSLAGGYFVQPNQIPIWWTAYSFYAYCAVAVNEFIAHTSDPAGQLYDCPYPGGTSNPACKQWTGAYIMQTLEIPFNDLRRPILILLGYVIVFFLGSGAILVVLKQRMGISRGRKTDTDYSAGKEKMAVRSLDEVRAITIRLQDYTLSIRKRGLRFWKPNKHSILESLDAEFRPAQLNVIMGPSGSGKTSLLNLMARRFHDSLSTEYVTTGQMTFNGAGPSAKVVRSICSYVCQDDDELLPYLTVRENLRFAAALRLPVHISKAEKRERAESVLLKMGLRDCADNLVGNEMVKGISGGEKRRTTIAIQILTDPRILFLDEPTSGLDAFTASSIVEVLRGLAAEGRTLVLTIHQARSDLFKFFHSILLLAQGGSVVYAGKGEDMLPHFAALGFTCPTTTNPADFALDLISVNLQNTKKESITREKVRSLILSWDQSRPVTNGSITNIATPAELGSLARSTTPFRIAFPVLMHRSFLNFRRNTTAVVARTTQVLGFAVVLTLFFAPLKRDINSINARLGFIQEWTALYFVGMLQCVAVYPKERDVFYREHEDNTYSVEAFFLQYTLAEVPFEIITCILFATLTVLAAGLQRTASLFFTVAFNAFAIVSCGESLGIMFNTLFSHTGFAVNVTSVFLSVATMMGGVMSLNIPGFLQAFNHLSPIKWSLGNLAPYTLRGVEFTCTNYQRLPNGQCPINTGEDVLKQYNFETNAELNLLAVGICTVVYRMVAFLVLKAKRTRWAL